LWPVAHSIPQTIINEIHHKQRAHYKSCKLPDKYFARHGAPIAWAVFATRCGSWQRQNICAVFCSALSSPAAPHASGERQFCAPTSTGHCGCRRGDLSEFLSSATLPSKPQISRPPSTTSFSSQTLFQPAIAQARIRQELETVLADREDGLCNAKTLVVYTHHKKPLLLPTGDYRTAFEAYCCAS